MAPKVCPIGFGGLPETASLWRACEVPWVLLPQAVALSVFDAFVGNKIDRMLPENCRASKSFPLRSSRSSFPRYRADRVRIHGRAENVQSLRESWSEDRTFRAARG